MTLGTHPSEASRRAAPCCALLGVCVLLALAGCGPTDQPTTDLPRLDELPAPSELGVKPADRDADHRPSVHRLVIQRLTFDREDPRVELALGSLAPPDLPARTLKMWRLNGLGLGRLDRDQAQLLLASMPPALNVESIVQQPGPAPAPIDLVGRLDERVEHVVRHLTLPGDAVTYRLVNGQFRLLVQLAEAAPDTTRGTSTGDPDAAPDSAGGNGGGAPMRDADEDAAPPRPTVSLLPQFFSPRDSLMPRSPLEKMYDGTTFDALAIEATIPRDTVWVIWHRGQADDSSTDTDDASDDGATDADAAEPRLLGRAMLTGRRRDEPMRLVLFITVRP